MSFPPLKLAIAYCWLSSLNLHYSNTLVVQDLNEYDIVVVGDGLANPSHGDYSNTVYIIGNTTASIYGYVDTTKSLSAVQADIDNWSNINGIDGIFFDQFGFDYGVTRQQQNDRVDYAHGKGLRVMCNSWNPDDTFARVSGKNHHLNTDDWYLAESHYLINGEYQVVADWEAKSDKMASYQSDAKMACIATTTTSSPFNQTKWDNAYLSHFIYGFDASGIGEPDYSATSALLPFRSRPTVAGTKFTGSLVKKPNNVYERQTNVGIHIDTADHTNSDLLD